MTICTLDRQRIDRWLWHARVVKTRTLAQKLVNGGKIRINREKVHAASTLVKAGDVVTIALQKQIRVLKIIGFSEKRGSAQVAQALLEDLSTPSGSMPLHGTQSSNPEKPGDAPDPNPLHPGGLGVGRPNKRDRKKLVDLKKIDVS